jgi:assimilatory nitrate reductase catalytic subunit
MNQETIKSTCPYCGVGCGFSIKNGDISGDELHPANKGNLCIKGATVGDSLALSDRLLYPKIGRRTVDWHEATDTIAHKLQQTIKEFGVNSVAMYLSGQCLTEDYYVANKLMKGFIGSANIDTNSRLCMASAVAAHIRAFGEDVVPVNYQDIDETDLIILVGSNALWTHPVLFRRIEQAKIKNPNMKLVVVDPRKTATAERADLFLPINPDTDIALFNGLMRFLFENKGVDDVFVNRCTEGKVALFSILESDENRLENVSKITGLSLVDLRQFYQWFLQCPKAITAFCQGTNQSFCATDKINVIINAHLLSGKFARVGCGPFSLTGQPNAMGGREVGGLANQLAVHRGFDDDSLSCVQTFWQAPNMVKQAGKKAVDLFDAIASGDIRLVWIMATNPIISLPEGHKIRKALAQCDCVIVSDITFNADTVAFADILLPAAAWGEKSGMVTNSERCMSRQRAFLPLMGESRPDWWAVCEVAKKLGYQEAFNFSSSADIFREHAALSGINQHTSYLFDISPLSKMTDQEYDDWAPQTWPLKRNLSNDSPSTLQPYLREACFATDSRKAQLLPISSPSLLPIIASYPWRLITGRQRHQWHTMTRTGYIDKLSTGDVEPTLYMNSSSIAAENLTVGDIVCVSSKFLKTQILVRLGIDDGLLVDQLFLSMHWAGKFGEVSAVNQLVSNQVDAISGQPAFKSTFVSVRSANMGYYGALFGDCSVPTHMPYRSFQTTNLGGIWRFSDKTPWCKSKLVALFSNPNPQIKTLSLEFSWGLCVLSLVQKGTEVCLSGLCLLSPKPLTKDIRLFQSLFDRSVDFNALFSLLNMNDGAPTEKMVCDCFQVTNIAIQEAVINHDLKSLDEIVMELKCGSHCGGCLPEVKAQLVIGQLALSQLKTFKE